MKEITKYVSDDGIEFLTKKKCKNYEDFYKRIKALKKEMPKEPKNDGCSFANGRGYLQWDEELFHTIKNVVLSYGYEVTHEKIYLDSQDVPHCRGIVGRYIDDSSNPKIKRVKDIWWRLMNIDDQYREWGQCYYALHPERAECIRLN